MSLVTNIAVIHISVVHEFFNGCENGTLCSRFAFKMYDCEQCKPYTHVPSFNVHNCFPVCLLMAWNLPFKVDTNSIVS